MRSRSVMGACGAVLAVVAGRVVHCVTSARTVAYLTCCSSESGAGFTGVAVEGGMGTGVFNGPSVGAVHSCGSLSRSTPATVLWVEVAGVSVVAC